MLFIHVTVPAHTAAVELVDGTPVRVLEPGRHRRARRASYVHVDLREQLLAVAPQEILTADGVQVRVSAAVRWTVADPVAWLERAADPLGLVYLATQVGLRDSVAALTLDSVSQRGSGLDAATLTAAVGAAARPLGIAVDEVVIKDVMVPAEVRAATLELATARQRGAAQLEMARAETAALRSLANGAKLLDDHPALARMRLVQSAPFGTQLVIKVGDDEPASSGPT
ncbi:MULTISPECIES: slipin family protein [unclassified Knoellia]|uniref:slipin family protein n=1 Tax=Knoellia altitudinis TaxID=3404795 RepID=UPI0036200323